MSRQVYIRILAVSLICTVSACAPQRLMRQGRQAERAGQYHRAYDLYCQVAEKRPSSGAAAAAIARVAPQASRYWEKRAHRAMEAGDYQTAWKHLMHTLTIRPDHPSAAVLVRRIERNHREQIGSARRAYLTGGQVALVVKEMERPPAREEEPLGVSLAQRDTVALPPAAELKKPTPQKTAPPASPPPAKQPRTAQPKTLRIQEPLPTKRKLVRTPHRPAPREAVPHEQASPYLVTDTVSREDRNYPKMVETIDGIFVKVKDTDPDPDADMQIYLGRHRVANI
ncbi:MAG: hypothetical protein ACYSVY_27060, partial [Planctomycetota bacterium]